MNPTIPIIEQTIDLKAVCANSLGVPIILFATALFVVNFIFFINFGKYKEKKIKIGKVEVPLLFLLTMFNVMISILVWVFGYNLL